MNYKLPNRSVCHKPWHTESFLTEICSFYLFYLENCTFSRTFVQFFKV